MNATASPPVLVRDPVQGFQRVIDSRAYVRGRVERQPAALLGLVARTSRMVRSNRGAQSSIPPSCTD